MEHMGTMFERMKLQRESTNEEEQGESEEYLQDEDTSYPPLSARWIDEQSARSEAEAYPVLPPHALRSMPRPIYRQRERESITMPMQPGDQDYIPPTRPAYHHYPARIERDGYSSRGRRRDEARIYPTLPTQSAPTFYADDAMPILPTDALNVWDDETDEMSTGDSYMAQPRAVITDTRISYAGHNYKEARTPPALMNTHNTRKLRDTRSASPNSSRSPLPPLTGRQPAQQRMTQPLNSQAVEEYMQPRTERPARRERPLPQPVQAPQPAPPIARRPSRPLATREPRRQLQQVGEPTMLEPVAAPSVCPKCRGAGYLRMDVPYGHPNFGKPIACACKEVERKEKRRQQLRDMSNLDAFQESTFETFNPKVNATREAFEAAYEYAHCSLGWLLLSGPNGSGKTHLAAAIANHCLENGAVVLFAVVPDLLDHLRAAFAPTSTEIYDQLFAKMREAEVLILDDLGAQQASPWANEKLFQLLNYRYNMEMPTVITANPKGMQTVDERIRSRLSDHCLVVEIQMDRSRDFRPRLARPD